jgi:hypothetical protein
MKKILSLIFFVDFTSYCYSQDVTYNFGLKIGHQFGTYGGLVWGWEASALYRNYENRNFDTYGPFVGLVFDYENCHNYSMLHTGIELGKYCVGVDIGPTFYSRYHLNFTGYTATAFAGAGIIPYYSYSYFPNLDLSTEQIGAYLKVPVNLQNIIPTE